VCACVGMCVCDGGLAISLLQRYWDWPLVWINFQRGVESVQLSNRKVEIREKWTSSRNMSMIR
jgi:hypothetical protein